MKYQILQYAITFCLLIGIADAEAQQSSSGNNRKAAFAGSFYPANKAALIAALDGYFSKTAIPDREREVQSIIVPHAGYDYSGGVTAAGFYAISPEKEFENIFIITTSHRISFDGASVYSVGDYETPLGTVEVNRDIAKTLIDKNKTIEFVADAHKNEHGIEVQLPMIQYYFKNPGKIVPIIIGTRSPQNSKNLAMALLPYFKPENLFIISTDFSNYPSYADAIAIDKITCDAIVSNSPEEFYNTLRANSERNITNLATSTYGWSSILTLLYMSSLHKEIFSKPLMYMNSGDLSSGDKERVVGYWAIASYIEPVEEDEEGYISEIGKEQLLEISRATLERFIVNMELPDINPKTIENALKKPTGVFVSLYMNGRLRGSAGQFAPTKPLYLAIQEMTAAAAVNDRNFSPVEVSELEYIQLEISLVTPLIKMDDISEFEVGRHGIFIVKGDKSGTFLPQAAKGTEWTAEEFISNCSRDKVGIGLDGWKDADLYIFEAIVFSEKRAL